MHIKYTNLIVKLSISKVYLLQLTVHLLNHLKLVPNTKMSNDNERGQWETNYAN